MLRGSSILEAEMLLGTAHVAEVCLDIAHSPAQTTALHLRRNFEALTGHTDVGKELPWSDGLVIMRFALGFGAVVTAGCRGPSTQACPCFPAGACQTADRLAAETHPSAVRPWRAGQRGLVRSTCETAIRYVKTEEVTAVIACACSICVSL